MIYHMLQLAIMLF